MKTKLFLKLFTSSIFLPCATIPFATSCNSFSLNSILEELKNFFNKDILEQLKKFLSTEQLNSILEKIKSIFSGSNGNLESNNETLDKIRKIFANNVYQTILNDLNNENYLSLTNDEFNLSNSLQYAWYYQSEYNPTIYKKEFLDNNFVFHQKQNFDNIQKNSHFLTISSSNLYELKEVDYNLNNQWVLYEILYNDSFEINEKLTPLTPKNNGEIIKIVKKTWNPPIRLLGINKNGEFGLIN